MEQGDFDTRRFEQHPVFMNRVRLPTEPIKEVFEIVSRTAVQRDPGCCFVAHPRFGKTSAITVLVRQLGQTFPTMPVLTVNAQRHTRFSEVILLGELLGACSHLQATTGKVDVRRSRLFKFLWTLAKGNDSDRILMFVDEAQNWQEDELSVLRDISNDLELHHNIKLIAVFFGQPELVNVKAALLQSKRIDLVGRFMIEQYRFNGISAVVHLATTMGFYDNAEVSEFPEGSGKSYSEFLLPLAYRGGWRLEDEAPVFWRCIKDAAQAHGGLGQVGMQWIAASIRSFFSSNLDSDHAGFKGTAEDWEAALHASGFINSLGITNIAEQELPPPKLPDKK